MCWNNLVNLWTRGWESKRALQLLFINVQMPNYTDRRIQTQSQSLLPLSTSEMMYWKLSTTVSSSVCCRAADNHRWIVYVWRCFIVWVWTSVIRKPRVLTWTNRGALRYFRMEVLFALKEKSLNFTHNSNVMKCLCERIYPLGDFLTIFFRIYCLFNQHCGFQTCMNQLLFLKM